MVVLKEKMKRLKADIKVWNKEVFGNVNHEAEELNKKLQALDEKDGASGLSDDGRVERKLLLAKLSRNRLKMEATANKKAKCKWLKQGDMNTKYFHAITKWRHCKNGLNGLLENDVWVEDPMVVKNKIRHFYKSRFLEGRIPKKN